MGLLETLGLKKKKKKPQPTTPPPGYKPPVDKVKAMSILTELRDLTVQASTLQLTLQGALEQRRAVIVQAVKDDDYVTGQREVLSLKTDLEQEESGKKQAARGRYDTIKGEVAEALKPLPGSPEPVTGLQKELQTAEGNYTAQVDGSNSVQVEALVKAVEDKLGEVKKARDEEANKKQEAKDKYENLKAEVAEALKPLPGSPEPVTGLQAALQQAESNYTTQVDAGSAAQAETLVQAVSDKLGEVKKARDDEANKKQQARDKYESLKGQVAEALKPLPGNPEPLPGLQSALQQAEATYTSQIDGANSTQAGDLVKAIEDRLGEVRRAAEEEKNKKQEACGRYETIKGEVAAALVPATDNPEPLTGLQAGLRSAETDYTSKKDSSSAAQVEDLVKAVSDGLAKVKEAREELKKGWDNLAGQVDEAKQKLDKLKGWSDADAGTWEAAWNAIDNKVKQGDYTGAVKDFPAFKAGVEEKFDDKQQWYDGKAAPDTEINKKLTDLEKLDTTVAEALRKRREDIDKTVTAKDFKKALGELTTLQTDTGKVLNAFRLHQATMNLLAPSIELAKKALLDTALDFGDTKTKYEEALNKVNGAKTLAKCGELPALCADLKTKLDALLVFYRENGTSSDHGNWLKERFQQAKLLGNSKYYQIVTVPLKSPAIEKLKGEFEPLRKAAFQTGNPATPTKANVKAWELMIAKADEILAAREKTDKAEAKLFKKYRPIQRSVEEAEKAVKAKSPPLVEADTKFQEELTKFRDFWDKDKNYAEAEKLIDGLRDKAQAVLDEVIKAGKEKVKNIGDMAEGTSGEKSAKRRAAREAINNNQLSQFQLESLTPAEQIKLMKCVRLDANMDMAEVRTAQKKLYGAMKLDQSFLEEEAKGRKAMTDKLLKEKKDLLLEAKSRWNKKPANPQEEAELLAEKKKVLEEVVKAQCDAFGFDPPTAIEFFEDNSVLNNGAFQPGDGKIVLNKKSVALNDFEGALDLVIHENHHNFQGQLVKKLKAGTLTEFLPPPPDNKRNPLYDEAQLFALNDEGGAYIEPGEGLKDYMKQPQEEHSWYSGPKTARGLVKELSKG